MSLNHKNPRAKLRVRYTYSSIGDKNPDSFMNRLVADAIQRDIELVSDEKQNVDLQITSVQVPNAIRMRQMLERLASSWVPAIYRKRDPRWALTNPVPSGRANAHLWFTGENVRPPSDQGWDGYLSFDVDSYGGKNAYCPIWWNSVGLYGQASSTFISPAPSIESLIEPHDPVKRRQEFAVAFINNPHPVRFHAINALRKVGNVQVFGNAVGRPVPNKAQVASKFRFVLCFENDLYPGYVTEKPIEAWATRAIPLWRGEDAAGYLNPKALVNAANFPDLSDFAAEVSRLDSDDDLRAEMSTEPLLLRLPDTGLPKIVIRNAVGLSDLRNVQE